LRFDPFEDFEKFAGTMLATKKMGIFHDWRRSAAQLVAAIWSLCGAAGAARYRKMR